MWGALPQWLIHQDARASVCVALAVRQILQLRGPYDVPPLRGLEVEHPGVAEADRATLEREFATYWALTVEPVGHRSAVPLDLVDGYDDLAVLPVDGAEVLRAAMLPLAAEVTAFARVVHERYRSTATGKPGIADRAYASAIAQHERRVGRRAHGFELNVEVLPLAQRGLWWIGDLTIAVTDGLRSDVVAFDAALAPIIAELA